MLNEKLIPGESKGIVFSKSPDSVDQILQVKSSEVDTRYFSSTSGWKAIEFTLSPWPPNSWELIWCYKYNVTNTGEEM